MSGNFNDFMFSAAFLLLDLPSYIFYLKYYLSINYIIIMFTTETRRTSCGIFLRKKYLLDTR